VVVNEEVAGKVVGLTSFALVGGGEMCFSITNWQGKTQQELEGR